MAFTLKQLAHARALAHHRNFRQAAVALHLTQPALTRSIQSLENSLGITLFDRLAAGVEPTELGKQLLAKSENILRETRELEREMGLLRGHQTGSLAIATGPYPACELVPAAVAGCLEQIPDLQCRLLIAPWRDSVRLLIDRECELVVAELSAASGDARFVATALGRDPLRFVCRPSHPLVSQRRPTLAQATAYPLAAPRVPARLAPVFAGSPRAGSVDAVTGDFLPAFHVESVAAAIGIVTSSNAVTAVPLVLVERQLQSGELVALDLPRNTLCLDSAVIQLQGRALSPAAKLFLEQLVRVKGDMSARESNLHESVSARRARARTRH
jgi:DNA-binding transcriptional LysR family regulator